VAFLIHHLISNKHMDKTCIYCGEELERTRERDVNYEVRECSKCGRSITIRKDFNKTGNGALKNIDAKIEEETRKLFLGPRVH